MEKRIHKDGKGLKEEEKMREGIRDFWNDESGMGTVEIILIIVVLIGLVIVFKKQINDLVTKIFKKITTDSNKIIGWDGSLHPFV
jgi:Flp pilus assembly pilin Flp